MRKKRIIVIGGGPAGSMAAISAADNGAEVILLEKNEKIGKKLYITGKGRCNITNNCGMDVFFSNILRNPKFLRSAFSKFSNVDLIDFFERNNVPLKTERGQRVFPVSDKSSDIISCLLKGLKDRSVTVVTNCNVNSINLDKSGYIVDTFVHQYLCDAVIIATGGLSYPVTGSTGDGYTFSERLGHSVIEMHPSLVPINEHGTLCASLQGLSLKNIRFSLIQNEKSIFNDFGELLFTHFGISGPVVLSSSCYIDYAKPLTLKCIIDLKPALDYKTLDQRVLRDFEKFSRKELKNVMSELLPSKMIAPFIDYAGLSAEKPVNGITKDERRRLVNCLKNFEILLGSPRGYNESIITRGGINTKEINSSTMESKLNEGLYFCGEVLDCDALTGGFNLQIAFSTGYLAGISSSKMI